MPLPQILHFFFRSFAWPITWGTTAEGQESRNMLDGLVMDVSSPGDIRPPPTNEWGWPYMQVGCLSLLTHPPTAWSAAVYCRPHSINGSLAPMDGLALAEVNSYTSDHRWYLGMVFCVALPGNHVETPFYGRLLSSLSPSG